MEAAIDTLAADPFWRGAIVAIAKWVGAHIDRVCEVGLSPRGQAGIFLLLSFWVALGYGYGGEFIGIFENVLATWHITNPTPPCP